MEFRRRSVNDVWVLTSLGACNPDEFGLALDGLFTSRDAARETRNVIEGPWQLDTEPNGNPMYEEYFWKRPAGDVLDFRNCQCSEHRIAIYLEQVQI